MRGLHETCATVNLYFHEIFETASEEYFWVPYSYSDSTTPSTNRDPKTIHLLLKDLAQRWQTYCLDGRLTVECGKTPLGNNYEEAFLVPGTNVWRMFIPYGMLR